MGMAFKLKKMLQRHSRRFVDMVVFSTHIFWIQTATGVLSAPVSFRCRCKWGRDIHFLHSHCSRGPKPIYRSIKTITEIFPPSYSHKGQHVPANLFHKRM
jgi:hypothetical protein